jgi:hypothetical protein
VVSPTVVVEKWLSTQDVIAVDSADPPTPAPPPEPAAMK